MSFVLLNYSVSTVFSHFRRLMPSQLSQLQTTQLLQPPFPMPTRLDLRLNLSSNLRWMVTISKAQSLSTIRSTP